MRPLINLKPYGLHIETVHTKCSKNLFMICKVYDAADGGYCGGGGAEEEEAPEFVKGKGLPTYFAAMAAIHSICT